MVCVLSPYPTLGAVASSSSFIWGHHTSTVGPPSTPPAPCLSHAAEIPTDVLVVLPLIVGAAGTPSLLPTCWFLGLITTPYISYNTSKLCLSWMTRRSTARTVRTTNAWMSQNSLSMAFRPCRIATYSLNFLSPLQERKKEGGHLRKRAD